MEAAEGYRCITSLSLHQNWTRCEELFETQQGNNAANLRQRPPPSVAIAAQPNRRRTLCRHAGGTLKRDLKSKKGANEGNEVNILSVICTDAPALPIIGDVSYRLN